MKCKDITDFIYRSTYRHVVAVFALHPANLHWLIKSLRRNTLPIVAMVCLLFFLTNNSYSKTPDCNPIVDIIEVATGIFVRQGQDKVVFEGHDIANIGFIVGERCVAVIDTGGSKSEGESLHCNIQKITDLPICYIINTHAHADHILGNTAFIKTGAQFIGHQNLPQAVSLAIDVYSQRASVFEKRTVSADDFIFPDLTINTNESVSIDIGSRTIDITAHNIAHTNNDLSLYDRKTNTLWLSDLSFVTHLPVVAGSLNGWIKELQKLMQHPAALSIPGHGPAPQPWPESAINQLDYFQLLKTTIKEAIAADTSLLVVQEKLMQDNPWQWTLYEEYRKRNLMHSYGELEWE